MLVSLDIIITRQLTMDLVIFCVDFPFGIYNVLTINSGCDLMAYCNGLINAGFSRISPVDPMLHHRPRYHGSVEEHFSLLESGRAVLKEMARDSRIQHAAAPTLLYPDLHKRNIFVSDNDPSVITGIID